MRALSAGVIGAGYSGFDSGAQRAQIVRECDEEMSAVGAEILFEIGVDVRRFAVSAGVTPTIGRGYRCTLQRRVFRVHLRPAVVLEALVRAELRPGVHQ